MDQAPLRLTICTQNLRAKADRYQERKKLLKSSLLKHKIDLLGLQEVQDPEHLEQILINKPLRPYFLDKHEEVSYSIHYAPLQKPIAGGQLLIQFNGIAHNPTFKALKHEVLHLSRCRNAQRALFEIKGKKIWFVNTHLHHIMEDEKIRHFQSQDIIQWMKQVEYDAIIIAGDFNVPPYESAYSLWRSEGYRSCFKQINGVEPGKTFPAGIWAPGMDTDVSLTTDYIWVKGDGISIKDSFLISYEGIETSDPHEALYPSDHYGVISECEIK